MTSLGLNRAATLPVGVPDLVSYRAKIIHNGLAIAEDGFEEAFLMLVGSKVQIFSGKPPQLLQIRVIESDEWNGILQIVADVVEQMSACADEFESARQIRMDKKTA